MIRCIRPFTQLTFEKDGAVTVCCESWTKVIVGNMKNSDIARIWNGEAIRYVRRQMLADKWEDICRSTCPQIISGNKLDLRHLQHRNYPASLLEEIKLGRTVLKSKPGFFSFANSGKCNLRCIMCGYRKEFHREDTKLVEKTMEECIKYLPNIRELHFTGAGDPFVRRDVSNFLINTDTSIYPQLKIHITTNGILFKDYWEKIRRHRFGHLYLSIDGATRETYEKIRAGAKWEDLLTSVGIIMKNRHRFENIIVNMVVMRSNYREIPELISLAQSWGFKIKLIKINGSWGNENFFDEGDILAIDDFRNIINKPEIMDNPHVDVTEFKDYLFKGS